MLRFTCPSCKTLLQLSPEYAGAVVSCPRCKTRMRVPRPAAAPTGPASAAPGPRPKPASTAAGGEFAASRRAPARAPDRPASAPGSSAAISAKPIAPPRSAPALDGTPPSPASGTPRWRTWGKRILSEVTQTCAATWGQTVSLGRYGSAAWRRRSRQRELRRARLVLGRRLLEVGGGGPELQSRLRSLDERIRTAETTRTATRSLKSERLELLEQLGAGAMSQVVLPAGLEADTRRAREAEVALHEQEDRLQETRTTLRPSSGTGWRRVATGYGAVLGLCVLSFSLLAGGASKPKAGPAKDGAAEAAELARMDNALKWVPADAAFYSGWYRNREQVEAVANSRAWAKLKALPAVQSVWQMAEAQLGQPGGPLAAFAEFYQKPENRELIEVLLDLGSHEVFVYGGEGSIAFVDLFQELYGATRFGPAFLQLSGQAPGLDPGSAQLLLLYRALVENQDRLKAPDLVIGFKVTKQDAVERQLKRLEREYEDRLGKDPQFKGRLQREKVGEHEFLTLKLDGKMVPWGQLPFRQFEEKPGDTARLIQKLSALRLTVSIGQRDGYLLAGIGESTDHLARLGQGKRLIDLPELRPLARFADRRLTSVGYVSKAMNRQLSTNKEDIDDIREGAGGMLQGVQLPAELRGRINKDLDALATDLKALIPEPGPALSFSFLTERGLESYRHDWGEPGMLDGSRPLTLLNHAGGAPLLVTAGRSKPPLEHYQLLVKWLKVAYGYVEELAVPQLEGPQREQYQQAVKEVLPLLKRLDETTAKMLLPALADGQAALVVNVRRTSMRWLQALPAARKPLPLPEPAVVMGVSDAALLEKAIGEYRSIVSELLAKGKKLAPGEFPELKLPEPRAHKVAGGTLCSFALPAELGVDPQIAPSAGLSDRVAVLALTPDHGRQLLTPRPLRVDSKPLADVERPLAGATYFNWAGLVEALGPWVELALTASNANLPGADPARPEQDTLQQVRAALDVLKVLRGYSSASWLQDGALVTHGETVLRDLDK